MIHLGQSRQTYKSNKRKHETTMKINHDNESPLVTIRKYDDEKTINEDEQSTIRQYDGENSI